MKSLGSLIGKQHEGVRMRKTLILLILAGFCMGEGIGSKSIGIQHSPFDLSGMVLFLIAADDESTLLIPGTELFMSNKLAGNMSLISAVAFARSGTTYDRQYGETGGYKRETTLQLIDVKVGVKIHQGARLPKRATSYLYAYAGKRFGRMNSVYTDYEYPDNNNNTDEDYEKYQNALLSPYMLGGGLGAEYFFNGSLSLTMMLNLDLYYTSGSYDDSESGYTDKRESSNLIMQTKPLIGLNIYF